MVPPSSSPAPTQQLPQTSQHRSAGTRHLWQAIGAKSCEPVNFDCRFWFPKIGIRVKTSGLPTRGLFVILGVTKRVLQILTHTNLFFFLHFHHCQTLLRGYQSPPRLLAIRYLPRETSRNLHHSTARLVPCQLPRRSLKDI